MTQSEKSKGSKRRREISQLKTSPVLHVAKVQFTINWSRTSRKKFLGYQHRASRAAVVGTCHCNTSTWILRKSLPQLEELPAAFPRAASLSKGALDLADEKGWAVETWNTCQMRAQLLRAGDPPLISYHHKNFTVSYFLLQFPLQWGSKLIQPWDWAPEAARRLGQDTSSWCKD